MGTSTAERVDDLIAKRRQIYEWYKEELEGVEEVVLNKAPTILEKPIFWMTSIVLQRGVLINRDRFMFLLKGKGIDTRPFFPPMSSFRMFQEEYTPVATRIGDNGINLPSGHDITRSEVEYVARSIKEILSA